MPTLNSGSTSTAGSSDSTGIRVRPMVVLRRRIVAGLLAAATVFAVIACSSDDPSPGEPDAPQVGS